MCGIVCYVGDGDTKDILIEGLHKLEYRGYDSAGIALRTGKSIVCRKVAGRIHKLEAETVDLGSGGNLGIAHTRWATHGAPTKENAHPHSDERNEIFVVHNGILENYNELKKELAARGIKLRSQTDTEILAHLIKIEFAGDLVEAVKKALKKVEGTFGIAVMHKKIKDKIVVARRSSPLMIGLASDGVLAASDVSAIVKYTDRIVPLEDEEIAVLTKDDFRITNLNSGLISREPIKTECTVSDVDKDGYPHFMLKEIYEQPHAIEQAVRGRMDFENEMPVLGGLLPVVDRIKTAENLIIISCGTSYYAAMTSKYIFEQFTNLDVKVELASEFRYSRFRLKPNTLALFISQSGETADTYAAMKESARKGLTVLGIVNVIGSSIARDTNAGVYIRAGMEIGVASTKCFTSQLAVLVLMALFIGRHNILASTTATTIMDALTKVSSKIYEIFDNSTYIEGIAEKYHIYNNWLFLGRKYNYPIALEGALKLKEISYIHAEGYAAGEMKHGPIALINKNTPSLFIAPKDNVYDKVISNMNEIKSRGGPIIAVATKGDSEVTKLADDVIYIPETLDVLYPILTVIPCQLIAYYCASFLGRNIDKPRNLAKSVTVE